MQDAARTHLDVGEVALGDLLRAVDVTLSRLPADHETRAALLSFRNGLLLVVDRAPLALVPPC